MAARPMVLSLYPLLSLLFLTASCHLIQCFISSPSSPKISRQVISPLLFSITHTPAFFFPPEGSIPRRPLRMQAFLQAGSLSSLLIQGHMLPASSQCCPLLSFSSSPLSSSVHLLLLLKKMPEYGTVVSISMLISSLSHFLSFCLSYMVHLLRLGNDACVSLLSIMHIEMSHLHFLLYATVIHVFCTCLCLFKGF